MLKTIALAAVLTVAAVTTATASMPQHPLLRDGTTINTQNATFVPSLPGMDGPLPLNLWSGFANITKYANPGQEMFMHYMIYESKLGLGEDVPVIVWFNGGPGAPSSWGFFLEGGPFLLNEESFTTEMYKKTGMPGLVPNKFAWTEFATLVSLDSPPPTGFSFCTPAGPSGDAHSCGAWNDTRVGQANAEALRVIFDEHFPHLLKNNKRDLYFIGESYGGVYITETAEQVVEHKEYRGFSKNLQGLALGDACMGTESGICFGNLMWSNLIFFYGHGQIPIDMWEALWKNCTKGEVRSGHMSANCKATVRKTMSVVGEYYTYNLNDQCPDNMFSPEQTSLLQQRDPINQLNQMRHRAFKTLGGLPPRFHELLEHDVSKPMTIRPKLRNMVEEKKVDVANMSTPVPPQDPNLNGYWCMGNVFEKWCNYSNVRTSLNVPQDSYYFIADDAVGMIYTMDDKTSFPFVHRLLAGYYNESVGGRKVKVMSYNGDADPCVNMFQTQAAWYSFASNHSYPKTTEWRNWFNINQPMVAGGYVAEWLGGQLTFSTVRGSGHMVPEYRPRQARSLMERWIKGTL